MMAKGGEDETLIVAVMEKIEQTVFVENQVSFAHILAGNKGLAKMSEQLVETVHDVPGVSRERDRGR